MFKRGGAVAEINRHVDFSNPDQAVVWLTIVSALVL